MEKNYRFQLIIVVLFFPSYFFGQTSFENVTSRIFGNDTYPNHTEGYSLVEVNENSLLLSTAYYTSSFGYLPKIYYANNVGVTSSFLPPVLGGNKIIKTSDGNFMSIRVVSDTTFRISKFDFNGNLIWSTDRIYGLTNGSVSDIVQTVDGGYAITGFFSVRQFSPYYYAFLLKLNSVGEVEWEKFFGSMITEMNEGLSLVQMADQGYAVACYSPYTKLNIFKTDSLGNLQWVTPLTNGTQIFGGGLDILPDNSLLVNVGFDDQQILTKIDESGNIINQFNYPAAEVGYCYKSNVRYISNPPGYLFVTDKFIITDTNGNIVWTGNPEIPYVQYKDIIKMNNGDMMAIGYAQTQTSSTSYSLEKIVLTRLSNSGILLNNESFTPNDFQIYPNPTSDVINLKLNKSYNKIDVSLYNQLGQLIFHNVFNNNQQLFNITMNGDNGIYLIKVKLDDGNEIVKKVVKK